MPSRSRQIKEAVDNGVLSQETSYCRKCMLIKPKVMFSKTTTPDLDSTGCLSLCKVCVDKLYKQTMIRESGSIQKTIFYLCRMLNVLYYEPAIESALKHIETKQSNPDKVFGLYRAKLLALLRTDMGETNIDLTYKDNPIINLDNKNILADDAFEEAPDLKLFWRTEDKDDLEFLEREFGNFKKTNKSDTHAEVVLLKEICFKLLDMDKDRRAGKSTDASLKQLMNVMEKSLISPNMANAANSGENLDTFGKWVEDIEKYEPAEWLEKEGRPMYKDVDDIEGYFQKFCVRPLRNFILQSKDFNIDDDALNSSETDIFEDSILEGIDEKPESSTLSE